MRKEKFDVVIPHLNYQHLRRSLTTFRKNTPPENVGKIILIDQNPHYQQVDDLVDIHVRIVNQGFAKACNLGIRISQSDFVFVVNDDVEYVHQKWVQGVFEVFDRYETALSVNPSSPRNPSSSGGPPVDHPQFPYKTSWTEEEYDTYMREVDHGYVIDGTCFFAPMFRRSMLDKLPGNIPGKAWFDEAFISGGGEDYDMNRRAYLSGLRCLGGGGLVYHWWYSTKRPETGISGVKYDNYFVEKWRTPDCETPDVYGREGRKDIPQNTMREYN